MKFNPEKCGVIHFGSSTNGRTYIMKGRPPESVEDLGVLVKDPRS